jgi:hypothetical protein
MLLFFYSMFLELGNGYPFSNLKNDSLGEDLRKQLALI